MKNTAPLVSFRYLVVYIYIYIYNLFTQNNTKDIIFFVEEFLSLMVERCHDPNPWKMNLDA